ncbi:MAG TPA: DUF6705 family protein [Flavobacterium sp.]|nr:DUF6705 family protein [Flavobacterium sp.]
MKNILSILIIIIINFTAIGQNPTIDINQQDGNYQTNAYYKDVNNVLNPFVGTYELTDGQKYFKIILQKKTLQHTANRYYEDLIIGEIHYIDENGITQVNTLNTINANYVNQSRHTIAGNSVLENDSAPACPECEPNEVRLNLGFFETYAGEIIVRRTNINGDNVIVVKKRVTHIPPRINGQPETQPSKIPDGTYVLIKTS